MAEREGFDVLRLIEHGQMCYISSEYVGGKILAGWLKVHPNITKERLFSLIRDITNQLYMIHRCRKKTYYQYVNPYSIVVTEEGEIYFLDLEAGTNEEQLRLMQRRVIREAFLPSGESYYQKASLELDIYGLGKTMQYLLAMTRPIPALCGREERRFLRIISRCLNDHPRLSYKDISEIRRSIPRYVQKTKLTAYGKKQVFLVCAAIAVLIAAWILQGVIRNTEATSEELELIRQGEEKRKGEEKKEGKEKKEEGDKDGKDEEIMMSDERELRIELAMLYILSAEDYEKGINCLRGIGSEYVSARNLRAVARALLGDERELTELAAGPEMDMRELEKSIPKDQILEYYRCLIKGFALLDMKQAPGIVLSLGESCIAHLEESSSKSRMVETEVRRYMAEALKKTGEFEEAAHVCEEILKLEEEDEKREEMYGVIAMLYKECGQTDKANDAYVRGIKELSDSEELRVMHIRLLCEDTSADRESCVQIMEEYVLQAPGLLQNEEFQNLKREYGLQGC